jgi:hypothetical protein
MANEITPVWQANRFYPLFGQLANIAPICAGQTVAYFARQSSGTDDSFGVALVGTTQLILAAGVCLFALYANIQRLHALDEASGRLGDKGDGKKEKKKKPKMSMVDSFKFLVQQKYLGYLCILVVSYGLSINLTEVIWKKMVKEAHPNKKEYQIFMGNYSSLVGAATFIIIFFGSNIVKHLGWKVCVCLCARLCARLCQCVGYARTIHVCVRTVCVCVCVCVDISHASNLMQVHLYMFMQPRAWQDGCQWCMYKVLKLYVWMYVCMYVCRLTRSLPVYEALSLYQLVYEALSLYVCMCAGRGADPRC